MNVRRDSNQDLVDGAHPQVAGVPCCYEVREWRPKKSRVPALSTSSGARQPRELTISMAAASREFEVVKKPARSIHTPALVMARLAFCRLRA